MRMKIVGKNPRAGGAECVIFGHVGRFDHRFAPVTRPLSGGAVPAAEFAAFGDWDFRPMRPGSALETAPALVGAAVGEYCHTSGRLVLVSHNWSGVLQINDIGRKYTVDLYAPETRLVLLDIVNEAVVDITELAGVEAGALALPPLPAGALVERIVAGEAWFRLFQRDDDFVPGFGRQAIEFFRPRPGDAMKLRLMAELLPKWRGAPAALPAPVEVEAPMRVRDDLRMLAAAVEGLALRGRV